MPHRNYIIYCDESDVKGKFFSNFYGGALIEAKNRQSIESELQAFKDDNNIFQGELKWEKVTPHYRDKYVDFVDLVFDIIARGDMKMRIMFTQNMYVPQLATYQLGNEYFLLYYQFIKHAFGLRYSTGNGDDESASAQVLLDNVPKNPREFEEFKDYLSTLSSFPVWRRAGFTIDKSNIAGVDSKAHNIMQAVDVILGGVNSKLNDKHTKVIPPAKRRSKRARAKGVVYKKIKERIFEVYPNFNIGASTGTKNGPEDRFEHPYRHWRFIPSNATVDKTKTKKNNKK